MIYSPTEPISRSRAKPGPSTGPHGRHWTHHSVGYWSPDQIFDPNCKGAGRFFGAKTRSDLAQALIRPLGHCSYPR